MSILANDKGTVEHRVNLIKRGEGELQHVMLNTVLIDKAENYGLMSDRFLTNNLPPIIHQAKRLVTIHPRYNNGADDEGFDYGLGGQPDHDYLYHRSKFDVNHPLSVARLCEALAEYFRVFNFSVNMQGVDFSPALFAANALYTIPRHNILVLNDNVVGHHPFDLGNNVPEDDIVKHVSFGLTVNGRVQLTMSSAFLSNFYIQLDEVFAKQLGLPHLVYAVDNQAGIILMSNQAGIQALKTDLNDPVNDDTFLNDPRVSQERTMQSTQSIFNVDDRLSLDIEISVPLAQSIDVFDGKEKHTYLLNRYMIADYVGVQSRAQQKGGRVLTKTLINDRLSCGLTDLVNNQPSSHTAKLMAGKIQELDMRLVKRFKEFRIENDVLKFNIARDTFQLDNRGGFYDLLLAFNKKV